MVRISLVGGANRCVWQEFQSSLSRRKELATGPRKDDTSDSTDKKIEVTQSNRYNNSLLTERAISTGKEKAIPSKDVSPKWNIPVSEGRESASTKSPDHRRRGGTKARSNHKSTIKDMLHYRKTDFQDLCAHCHRNWKTYCYTQRDI